MPPRDSDHAAPDMGLLRQARAGDLAAIARVDIDTWQQAYRGIVADDWLDAMCVAQSRNRWAPRLTGHARTAIWVHEDASSTVDGFVVAGPLRVPAGNADGEIQALYVSPSAQGQGIGRALMAAAAAYLAAAGFDAVSLWVLVENRLACDFYARLGGERGPVQAFTLGRQTLLEVAYRWPHIHVLTNASPTSD